MAKLGIFTCPASISFWNFLAAGPDVVNIDAPLPYLPSINIDLFKQSPSSFTFTFIQVLPGTAPVVVYNLDSLIEWLSLQVFAQKQKKFFSNPLWFCESISWINKRERRCNKMSILPCKGGRDQKFLPVKQNMLKASRRCENSVYRRAHPILNGTTNGPYSIPCHLSHQRPKLGQQSSLPHSPGPGETQKALDGCC